nr:MAG TPA: putative outer membrane protein [Caudoviricetes sp.]
MKKIIQFFVAVIFAFVLSVPVFAQAQTVPTTITNFKVTDKLKQELDSAYTNQDIYLEASWQAQGAVHEGDTFTLSIPNVLDFPADGAGNFNIYAPDGEVMATAQVTAGKVTITYTSWVENKENVNGTLWLAAHVKSDAEAGQTILRLVDDATGQVVETSFTTKHYGALGYEIIAKWGVKTDHNTVEWSVRLNQSAENLTNVFLKDIVQNGTTIVPGSFRLYSVTMDEKGNASNWVRVTNVPDPVLTDFGFTWDLSSIDFNGKQYFMYYETEGIESTSNYIQLKSRETAQDSTYQYVNQDSGGNGNGNNQETPVEPEPTPTPEPTPGPQPTPTPEDNESEPQPEAEKPVKKVKKKKKAVLPATGDYDYALGMASTALGSLIGGLLVVGGTIFVDKKNAA